MNSCRVCSIPLTDENWFPSLRAKNCVICKKCNNDKMNVWRKANRSRANELGLRHYRKDPSRHIRACHKARVKVRLDMIKEYGGACVVCGINDVDVLDIDHVNNNGAEHRKNGFHGYNLYRFLKKNNYPKDDYQLLCKNCNWKKEILRRRADKGIAFEIFKAIEAYNNQMKQQLADLWENK